MHGGRFVYRSSPSRLTTSCSQSLLNERSSRSVGDVTDEERIPTCGVSNSGNAKVRQRPRAKQPAWNRSWAQTSSVATASKRYRELVLQTEGFPHQIARNSRNNFLKVDFKISIVSLLESALLELGYCSFLASLCSNSRSVGVGSGFSGKLVQTEPTDMTEDSCRVRIFL